MAGWPEDDADPRDEAERLLWRPVWEDAPAPGDDALPGLPPAQTGSLPPALQPTATPPQRGDRNIENDDWRGLLLPLTRVQDALARLETAVALASAPVREGLIARLALHEAAGWLAQSGAWVSTTDLALRDAGLVGSWALADRVGDLAAAMPATAAAHGPLGRSAAYPAAGSLRDGAAFDGVPDDRLAGHALLFARHWHALAATEVRVGGAAQASTGAAGGISDGGGADPEPDGLYRALVALGRDGLADAEWRGWLTVMAEDDGLPPLLRAARLAGRWQEERGAGEGGQVSLPALFLAAALWRGHRHDALPLLLWSAPPAMLHALALGGPGAGCGPSVGCDPGVGWAAGLLGVAAAAARRAHGELRRLQDAERRGVVLAAAATARSRLPAALDTALRLPVLTASTLAARLGVSPRAGLALVGQLVRAGVLREVTGRGAWRAYVLV